MEMNWQCPFCGRHTTITDERFSEGSHLISLNNKHGDVALRSVAIACPNKDCRELVLIANLNSFTWSPIGKPVAVYAKESLATWRLRPQGASKIFPDYVPASILADYREACLIRDLSPKASATLSRRCLQGMIRDFWKIQKSRLKDEIDALEEKVDLGTWDAIDAVRQIGNIGAHMERNIDLVLDVEPHEAALLIGLIETLIEDWYIARYQREQRMSSIKQLAAQKKTLKDAAPIEGADPKKVTS